MEYVFLLLLLAGVAWWLNGKLTDTRTELEELRCRLARQEEKLADLRADRTTEPTAPADVASPEAASLAARVLEGRRQAPAPDTPIPPPLASPRPAASTEAPPARPLEPGAAKPAVRPVATHPAVAAPAAPTPRREIDWEQFLGVKLFAWVGGLALFLAAAFFVKYSFDNNLISPALRVATGFLGGLGLLVGGALLRKKDYEVTSQTLCATGVVILYATSFACHGVYEFTGVTATFLLMTVVTVAAFWLAVRMEAQVVAVLGLVGGFLTPPLLSTGVDQPLGLFGYVFLLDVGLLAVAFRRRWHYLALLGALGTVLTELAWRLAFLNGDKTGTLLAILVVFNALFLGAAWLAVRWRQGNVWVSGSALLPPLTTFLMALSVVSLPLVRERPVWFFALVLLADGCWLAATRGAKPGGWLAPLGGGLAFLLLAGWSALQLREATLGWTLAAYLGFGVTHSIVPLLPGWRDEDVRRPIWVNGFPAVTLLLFLLPLTRHLGLGFGLWITAFLVALLGVGLALLTGSRWGLLTAGGAAFAVLAWHAVTLPLNLSGAAALGAAVLIGGFGLLFVGGALAAAWWERENRSGDETTEPAVATGPALSGLMPFLLLGLVSLRLPLEAPHAVFAVGLVLVLVLLAAGRLVPGLGLEPVALGGVLLLQLAWHAGRFAPATAGAPLAWNCLFVVLFLAWPFVAWGGKRPPVLPWATAAVAPMVHFFLIYDTVKRAWLPENPGWIPAAFVLPVGAALWWLVRVLDREAPQRNTLLAWFGASVLFFVTFIFPIQFDRQWLTLGWAFEGVALLWLFHRVPHPGLRGTGVGLLLLAFGRLMINPALFEAGQRGGTPLLNWLLYTYGLGALAMFVGAQLLAPPRERVFGMNAPPLLRALGTVLLFGLLNLEIADYFSAGDRLDLAFTGNFARDMSYSIGWALFAITLLAIGVAKRQRTVRFASAGLLGITLLKLFLHDLVNLSAPYRIGAFFGVAVVAILASVLYQRFFAGQRAGSPSPSGVID